MEAAVTAVLDAAIQEQIVFGKATTVLVFNQLGGGLYWPKQFLPNGPKKDPQPGQASYRSIFLRALAAEVVAPGGQRLKKAQFFKDVVLTGL